MAAFAEAVMGFRVVVSSRWWRTCRGFVMGFGCNRVAGRVMVFEAVASDNRGNITFHKLVGRLDNSAVSAAGAKLAFKSNANNTLVMTNEMNQIDARGKHRIYAELKRLEQDASLLQKWNNLEIWSQHQLCAKRRMALCIRLGIAGLKDHKILEVSGAADNSGFCCMHQLLKNASERWTGMKRFACIEVVPQICVGCQHILYA
ncbi:hypothetical protein AKJ16_DCAP12358 [Drosera capensis]